MYGLDDSARGEAAFVAPPLPDVLAVIDEDARAGRLAAWSTSTVIDENVGEPVIGRELFDRIHDAAGVHARFPVGNAGLIHVYGYLFSTVRTPFGYKRDRWNDGALARTLGLPDGWFRLGESTNETPLERVLAAALPLLANPPAAAHVAEWRINTTVSAPEASQRAVVVAAPDGSGALVSGVDAGAGMKLLTLFPVADAAGFAQGLTGEDPRPRWNAAPPPRA